MVEKDKRIIKDSEDNGTPIFTITAKDKVSVDILRLYLIECTNEGCNNEHLDGIFDRIEEFEAWQDANPDKVKKPD